MRLLLTCGGTAGHIYPAVGVAARLAALRPDTEFLFIGAKGGMENELVRREGYDIESIEISNLSRRLSLAGLRHNLHTVRTVFKGTAEAGAILDRFRPDAAVGTGGYVCYPVLKAAHKRGIPTLVHESNAVPGLTTKLLARSVACVMVGFENVKENYPAGVRVEYTGTPVRPDFQTLDRRSARAKLGIPNEARLLVSVWGSLGSGQINGMMPELVKLLAERGGFRMIHAAGRRYYPELVRRVGAETGLDPAGCRAIGADIREYIYDMPAVMAAADLVMCRSGASTLGELAALGKPALLVPSPNVTNHHQEKNARALEALGAAEVLLEGQFDAAGLLDRAEALLRDGPALGKMSAAMRSAGVPDAADRIAKLILDAAGMRK